MAGLAKITAYSIFIQLVFVKSLWPQQFYLPLNRDYNLRYEPWLYNLQSDMHTSVRPFMSNEVEKNAPFDSLSSAHYIRDNKFNNTWVGRKLFKEHLFEVKGEDFNFYLDPAFEFKIMHDRDKGNLVVNTRGVWLSGNIGERFSFSTSFYESLSKFPAYLDSFIQVQRVIPGGARPKKLYGNYDYNIASGTISYSLKKYFNFQFGHDKVFIGDGYRSLLFSDNAFNFPYLKITLTIWKIKYQNLYVAFQDRKIPVKEGEPYKKKYGTFHYLDFNIGKRASIGLLEAVIWKSDSVRGQCFDVNYLNPIIFFRPVEFSLNSPDNALIGFTAKYKITGSITAYSQLLLDEFKIEEVRAGNGWWANKQAVQFGIKYFNVAGIKNLHLNTEYNFVRPYTYQHWSSLTAYAHYNQSITHPLGANFWESVSIINYSYKNFGVEAEIMYAEIGYDYFKDSLGNVINYGQDVWQSYFTHPNEYGNEVGQGLKTKQLYTDFKFTYLVNPKSNLRVEAGLVNRIAKNELGKNETLYFYFGIRTALTNRYYDF
ncbi:MAG: hypothetical protein ACHQNT_00895 [Bacteroidia bacterium]